MFQEMYPVDDCNQAQRDEAFEKLQNLRRTIPDLDEKKELEAYRTERYGA